jgi:hypothetical protein
MTHAISDPPPGFVTLGQIAGRLAVLDVACNRCDRRRRLRVDRLMVAYGPDLPIPELRHLAATDCPRMLAETKPLPKHEPKKWRSKL